MSRYNADIRSTFSSDEEYGPSEWVFDDGVISSADMQEYLHRKRTNSPHDEFSATRDSPSPPPPSFQSSTSRRRARPREGRCSPDLRPVLGRTSPGSNSTGNPPEFPPYIDRILGVGANPEVMQVTNHILLSDIWNATNPSVWVEYGVTHILTVTIPEHLPSHAQKMLKMPSAQLASDIGQPVPERCHIAVAEKGADKTRDEVAFLEAIPLVHDFINRALDSKDAVVVIHCGEHEYINVACLIAYFMDHYHIGWEEAFVYIHCIHPDHLLSCLLELRHFQDQLEKAWRRPPTAEYYLEEHRNVPYHTDPGELVAASSSRLVRKSRNSWSSDTERYREGEAADFNSRAKDEADADEEYAASWDSVLTLHNKLRVRDRGAF